VCYEKFYCAVILICGTENTNQRKKRSRKRQRGRECYCGFTFRCVLHTWTR
jgi:hypothetical protein